MPNWEVATNPWVGETYKIMKFCHVEGIRYTTSTSKKSDMELFTLFNQEDFNRVEDFLLDC